VLNIFWLYFIILALLLVVVVLLSFIFFFVYRPIADYCKRNNQLLFKKAQKIEELDQGSREITTLRDLLPICASCKKIIRDDKGCWNQIEACIQTNSVAESSHGICPQCAVELYPDFYTETDKIESKALIKPAEKGTS
jgi:hypothetical protein